MNIRGIYKTSLINFPGRICTILFAGGCNLRCRYCHNPKLVHNDSELQSYAVEEIIRLLEKRKSMVNAVTLSGGEPTIDPGLEPFLERLKDAGFYVKLDTNGLNPVIIRRLVERRLLDYAAVDVKTSPEKYYRLTGREVDFGLIKQTIALLENNVEGWELRTTCVPGFAEINDFEQIKYALGRVKKYYIQQFVPSKGLLDAEMSGLEPHTDKHLREVKKYIESFADLCEIRGF